MARKTVYLVSRIGWEYNDENYFRGETGGGTPVLGFTTREKAQAECDKRNANLKHNNGADGYVRSAEGDEEGDEYGMVPITEDFEVITVQMEE